MRPPGPVNPVFSLHTGLGAASSLEFSVLWKDRLGDACVGLL